MDNVPETPELVALLRNANPQVIRQRLAEINGEEAALRTLLRSVEARERGRLICSKTEGRRDE